MTIPITGILLIPLGLLIAFLPWQYCLIGLATFSMLSAAAVVNVGSFGLQPGYYLALLLIARIAVEIAVTGFILNAAVLARLRPLFLFLIVVFAVLFVALAFFQGRVETLPGSLGFKSTATRPFYLGRENITQIAYLFINLVLLYGMAHEGARRGIEAISKSWDLALLCGLGFAAFVCLWQFASFYAGVPFLGDFFYSNAGYSRSDGQTMAGLFRINGPFEEPSTLGYMFTGYLLFAWRRYRLYPTALSAAMIAVCIFCMLVSTSTTAFFGLFLCGCMGLLDVATGRIHLATRTLSGGQVVAIVLGIIGIVGGSILFAANWQAIYAILQNVVFNKSESTSFQQRSFADFLAMRIFVETYGLGIGLGSHKANSLMLTLLSGTGFVGLFLFTSFLYTLLRPASAALGSAWRGRLPPFQWGLAGLVLIHVFSNPNLSTLELWIQMGGVLSLQVALRRSCVARDASGAPYMLRAAPGLALPYREA
jgi:hypothetical protein